ncbi:MAG: NAD(P)H-hydrate dehydratase, partial [Lysobacteraceae bacterium]
AAAWRVLLDRWPQARRIGIVCGPGNNGGDGYVLALHARACGRDVVVITLPDGASRSDPARALHAEWIANGGMTQAFDGTLPDADVWVDALFGIGLARAPDGAAADLIMALHASARPVFALDVPSGADADSGHVPSIAVRAECTLQFIVGKRGLYTGMARMLAGEVLIDDLQLPAALLASAPPSAELLRADALHAWLPRRARDANKGNFGHVLCVGGDLGTGGAVMLCAQSVLRCGAGLVSVATRASHVPALLAARPEAMAHAVEDSADFAPLLQRATVIAVGPGLGQGEWGRALYAAALAAYKPLVIDADALNLLAQHPQLLRDAVLTPHPGEAARLLDVSVDAIQRDRFAAAQAIAERYAATVVLKGAGSLVAAPGEVPAIIDAGNPGMAGGGVGDVLTGVIAALRAQGLAAFDAARCGALLHAAAGDAAACDGGERGLLASDLFPHLRRLANPCN